MSQTKISEPQASRSPSPEHPNTQLFECSPLAGSSISEEAAGSFFNQKDPNLAIIHEKPEHRFMLTLKLEGFSNREIARRLGYTDAWVSQVMRQPWARQFLSDQLGHAGRDRVESILAGAVEDSVWKLIEIRDEAEREETQLAAAKDILDRYLGKATQRVESLSKNVNVNATIEDIDAKIRELEREEKELRSAV